MADMFISRPLNGVIYVAELPRLSAARINGLHWSRVSVEPIAGGDRRIAAGRVPKRIRRAAYRLFEGDRRRASGRSGAPRLRPVKGSRRAHPAAKHPAAPRAFY